MLQSNLASNLFTERSKDHNSVGVAMFSINENNNTNTFIHILMYEKTATHKLTTYDKKIANIQLKSKLTVNLIA